MKIGEYESRDVVLTVWANSPMKDGKPITTTNITIMKRYPLKENQIIEIEKRTGQKRKWGYASNYRKQDIPDVKKVLNMYLLEHPEDDGQTEKS